MRRKGQAALDYLTTYGWALMALAIALGAIYMFLDYKPERLIPETCSFGDSFNCRDFSINQTNKIVTLSMTNEVGTEITLSALSCTYVGENKVDKTLEGDIIGPGETFSVSCNMSSPNIVFKKKSKIDVTLIYFKKGMSFPSSSDGFVSGGVMK